MKLHDFIQGKVISGGKAGYWVTLKALFFGIWSMLFRPGKFEKDGEIIENIVENGTFRVFLGGFMMILVGIMLILVGFLCSLALLATLLGTPIIAAYITVHVRIFVWFRMRELMKRADEVTKDSNRGQ